MKKKLLLLILVVLSAAAFIGCRGGKADSDAAKQDADGAINIVLNALLTCPNDDLYDSGGAYISLDDSDVGSTEEDLEHEKNAWKETVGDCFAKDRFDSFYGQWERTAFLGEAYIQGDTIELTDIETEEGDDLVKTVKATIIVSRAEGAVSDEIQTTWIITLDNDDKIQKIELTDDGGYL